MSFLVNEKKILKIFYCSNTRYLYTTIFKSFQSITAFKNASPFLLCSNVVSVKFFSSMITFEHFNWQ